ncbi:hypothetical protein Vadar_033466 [Vaccinium darrowii]|uniref:Uncharacterized protein n=1 Tax=Vaccinium darrowii TaxID=229202 RepID=A0ACB7YRX4_9ERIC|nr:hypothetical protein Vadar_033466 [Vaccinium darrowii]
MDINAGALNQFGVEKLCMEAYLQGQDLWEIVNGGDSEMPTDTPENAEARRKWKIKCGKALFALCGSISKELIEHIRAKEKPKEIWQLLEQLFAKKHMARLQMLENELANTTQGWATQPTIIELENLLSNQEALAKQMASASISGKDDALFIGNNWKNNQHQGKNWRNNQQQGNNKKNNQNQQQGHNWKNNQQQGSNWKKKNQQTVMVEGNVGAFKNGSGKPSGNREWDTCLSTEILDKRKMSREPVLTSTNASMNVDYKKDWIIDSGCSHHLTSDDSLFSSLQEYKGQDAIVTADNSIHPVKNEGTVKVNASNVGCVTLNSVYHVPGMTKNLVSVSQISNSGKYVLFGTDDIKVLSNIRNMEADILLEGKRVKSLYVLSASDAYVEKTSKQDNASLWHA